MYKNVSKTQNFDFLADSVQGKTASALFCTNSPMVIPIVLNGEKLIAF